MCYSGVGGGGVAYSEIIDQDLGTMAPGLIKRHNQADTPKEVSKKVPREKYNRYYRCCLCVEKLCSGNWLSFETAVKVTHMFLCVVQLLTHMCYI